jgi:hypothetical protein
MPTSDHIKATAERISGNPTSGAIRLFIDDLITALDDEQPDSDAIPVTERREQPRLQ